MAFSRNVDDIETNLQVNHLSPMLLTLQPPFLPEFGKTAGKQENNRQYGPPRIRKDGVVQQDDQMAEKLWRVSLGYISKYQPKKCPTKFGM